MSQEEKEPLLEGIVIVDSQSDSLAAALQVINFNVDDVVARCMMTSTQYISTPLLSGTSSRSLVAESFVAF